MGLPVHAPSLAKNLLELPRDAPTIPHSVFIHRRNDARASDGDGLSFREWPWSAGADIGTIVQALSDNPLAVERDGNGNARMANRRWIKYDSENRPLRVITAEGKTTDYWYDYEGTRVKRTVTPPGGSPTSAIYIGDAYEKAGSTGTAHLFAGGRRIGERAGGIV